MEAVIFQSLPLIKNEKMTVDLSSTKFVIYYKQKVQAKIRKWLKRPKEGKIKASNQKDSEDKIISTLHRFICPHKHNGISYSVFTKYEL